jgi:hypothetical protein
MGASSYPSIRAPYLPQADVRGPDSEDSDSWSLPSEKRRGAKSDGCRQVECAQATSTPSRIRPGQAGESPRWD